MMPTIRELRQQAGMTQAQLAHAIGTTQETVHRWERGRILPNVLHLKALARLFGVSMDDVILGEPASLPEDPNA